MAHFEGLIFDLDGVLLSTDHFHYRAWKALADKLEIPFDEEKNNLLRGVSRMESLMIILGDRAEEFTQEQLDRMCTEKNDMYRDSLAALTPSVIEDMVRTSLYQLRQRGMRLAVGSSSKNATTILERTQLADAFDAIIDGNSISRSKPDPEVFLTAADALELSPVQCAVIEDAQAGVDAAKAGGFYAIAFGERAQQLENADAYAANMDAVCSMVGN